MIPAHVTYTSLTPQLLAVAPNGTVNCQDDGVAVIEIAAVPAHARVPIRCLLVRRFGRPNMVRLIAGGPPVPLDIEAYDGRDNPMPSVRLQLTIDDTTIIALRNGLVYGLRAGAASIRVRSFHREGGQVFFVYSPSDRDSSLSNAKNTR
ncbi:MAG TPA: hypothetical protein VH539_15535 [Gemmatimonadaceae bacterium]